MRFRTLDDLKDAFFQSERKALFWRVFLIRTIGNILILGSIAYVCFLFYPVASAELAWRFGQLGNQQAAQVALPIEQPRTELEQPVFPTNAPVVLPPLKEAAVDTGFGILIEKIGANARIVPSVDPFNPKDYDVALTKGVAHAKGTVFPGEVGNVYLFAHNTLNAWDIPRYNAVFFLLHNLEPGDRISTFYKEQRFDYVVFDKKVHKPSDLSPLTTKYSEPILSLQTCWPPGTTWQRMIVRAKLVR